LPPGDSVPSRLRHALGDAVNSFKEIGFEMTYRSDKKIEELKKKILANPEKASLYDELLWIYFDQASMYNDPSRIDHILECIKRFPREKMCRTPFVHIDPKLSPDGFQQVEIEWKRLLAENPEDPLIALGAANFYCPKNVERAKDILRQILDNDSNKAEVWLDLGRYTYDPHERLDCFLTAQKNGAKQPNLIVWIASAAVEACDYQTAEEYAITLLDLVDIARNEYGNKLDWNEKGGALFEKALQDTGNWSKARKLVNEISAHAYHKHWGHTVLGHVSLHKGDLQAALCHLRESGEVVSDCRLSSYGPSLTLAKKICALGEWAHVAEYLKACESFWDDERLPIWVSMVESKKIPDFQ
jgi:tetratricopeptide (TPR) repeat protein